MKQGNACQHLEMRRQHLAHFPETDSEKISGASDTPQAPSGERWAEVVPPSQAWSSLESNKQCSSGTSTILLVSVN